MILTSATVQGGTTIRLSGYKFNGASQNNAYGDDFQGCHLITHRWQSFTS